MNLIKFIDVLAKVTGQLSEYHCAKNIAETKPARRVPLPIYWAIEDHLSVQTIVRGLHASLRLQSLVVFIGNGAILDSFSRIIDHSTVY